MPKAVEKTGQGQQMGQSCIYFGLSPDPALAINARPPRGPSPQFPVT